MEYRTLGDTGWAVSAIGLGTWNLGNQWGEVSDETARRIVRSAIDAGVNFVDTAESYGDPHGTSELRLGDALDGRRDDVYLCSKVGHWGKRTGQGVPKSTPDLIRCCGHAIAGRLGVETVDLLLCHESDVADPEPYVEGFERLVDEGFVREYGISTDDIDVLERFYEAADGRCAAVEFDYSLVDRGAEDDILPFCAEHDLAPIVRTPLARGLLTGKYDRDTEFTDQVRSSWNAGGADREEFERKLDRVERIEAHLGPDEELIPTALRYVASHPTEPVVIPGATTPAQAVANAAAGDRQMDAERRAELEAI
jgi:myo-inositol catabolism protein IolS